MRLAALQGTVRPPYSFAPVATRAPATVVVRSPENIGFARGTNLGIERCEAGLIALLNNDCVPEPTWLERAVAEVRDQSPQ